MPYQDSAPAINPNTFPYLKKFSKEELGDLFERIDRLREHMTDMVGPSGVVTYIDGGTIANIAFHLAMCGHGDEPPAEKALIWPDVQEDEAGIFEGYVTWRLKKEHEPPPPKPAEPLDPEAVEKAAVAARDQINAQLHPQVRKALISQLAKEFEHDTTDKDGEPA